MLYYLLTKQNSYCDAQVRSHTVASATIYMSAYIWTHNQDTDKVDLWASCIFPEVTECDMLHLLQCINK